jgi:His-Xaa-Ser system protein HxsD
MKIMDELRVWVSFSPRVYSIESVKRAAYKFTDMAYFDISASESEIICEVNSKPGTGEGAFASMIEEFRNEVLDQDLRESISRETADIRNVILAYVFSKTSLLAND